MQEAGYVPAIVVIGDLENEGNADKQIDWEKLPLEVAKTKEKTGQLSMMFLYASPDKLDFVKEKLSPILGESNLIIATHTTANKVLRQFLSAIGR